MNRQACDAIFIDDVGTGSVEMIAVNFADVFGFVCSAVGATDVASGPSHSIPRLNLNAFRDEQFGIAVPQYYAHRVIGEFKTENDLNRLVQGGCSAGRP